MPDLSSYNFHEEDPSYKPVCFTITDIAKAFVVGSRGFRFQHKSVISVQH